MWRDSFVSVFDGHKVSVTRNIESPASPDELVLTFEDNSKLSIRFEVDSETLDSLAGKKLSSEAEAAEVAKSTLAGRVYQVRCDALRTNASSVSLDTDLL